MLVMTLLVRDERDIIRENIAYHLSQGVDFIIATDNGSVDGTSDILREYERQGCLRLLIEEGDTYAQSRWVTRMARMASEVYGARFVINSDADEFWWPATGTLKEHLTKVPSRIGGLSVVRTNFPPTPDESGFFYDRQVIRERVSLNGRGDPLPPKVCHRGCADVVVAQGNHSVSSPTLGKVAADPELTIFHFPLRTYRQLENKIAKGGAAYERNLEIPKEDGDAWRWLYGLYREGALERWYAGQLLRADDAADGVREGRLIEDRRLQLHLRATRRDSNPRLPT
jgi:glycosyl transferase family 2